MRYEYRAAFMLHEKRLIHFLKRKKIAFEEDLESNTGVLYFYEDEPQFNVLNRKLKRYRIPTMITTKYTVQEMEEAKWFYVRSKWLINPEDKAQENVYDYNPRTQCLCNKVQVNNFALKKEIKWKNRYFCSMNGAYDELLVNKGIAEKLETSGLKGFHFRDVYVKSELSETTVQLVVENRLEEEMDFNRTRIKEQEICSTCGQPMNIMLGKEQYYFKSAFQNLDVDIIRSKTIFGYIGARDIYITQRFYRYLIENKWDKNLEFEPIFFSDED